MHPIDTPHTVVIDRTRTPNAIRFPAVFNVAVPFIDRPVAEGRGDRPALRTEAGDISYRQLAENVARAGQVFLGLGLKRGERLLMVVRDTPMFFYVFWGAVKAGLVPVGLSTMMKAADYQYSIEDSGGAALIYSPAQAGEVTPAAQASALKLRHLLSTDELERRMAGAPTTLEAAPTSATEDCFWLYSSGSTGKPKGVVHVHRDMVITSERYGQGIAGIKPDDLVFCASKLFFSYGFGGGMTFPLWAQATILLCEERPSADMAFAMIERHKPTVFFGVPTLYGQMVQALDSQARDTRSIRACLSAGEALPEPIFTRWKEKTGVAILDGIGSTEVLHIFVSNRHNDIRPGTSGKPVPGYEVKIVDGDERPVADGEVGILMVKGESNARCYWNNPEKTASTMRGEWLNTGDMYIKDADGYYANVGRGDDMLKVGGMWCSPLEIESRLLAHPKIAEAAVIGQPDAEGLIKPAAYVVLRNKAEAGPAMVDTLVQHCKSGLAGYKYPRWFYFIDDLPKTVTGKIQRFRLRQAPSEQYRDREYKVGD
ncbi:MAG: benzoate-CoA ligase family protein [Rhodospirillales bacterium]|nr:benzoate-CoA ligase family protein [Rhodospirillales bacterium]